MQLQHQINWMKKNKHDQTSEETPDISNDNLFKQLITYVKMLI